MDSKSLLRTIPKVDALCAHPVLKPHEGVALTKAARTTLELLRQSILEGGTTQLPSPETMAAAVLEQLKKSEQNSLRPVINATGVILHTNLGRACLSQRAVEAVAQVAGCYSTLEYDIERGQRGSRHTHVEGLLCALTGAEAAMAVNNNAAAVLLTLAALCKGGEVVVSRGELVEIGGSFRVPEVMEQGGAVLREVGTTNKTHLSDYENALGDYTCALLKVHTSNYRIVGFTESVALKDLVALGQQAQIPVIEDLGSGFLVQPERFGITDEPFVPASVAAGVDVVTFSGDKLLGGPQAGLIVGKKEYLDRIKKHPLARAMRIDKLTLAALEATLKSYQDIDHAIEDIPVLRMLSATAEQLEQKAQALVALLKEKGVEATVVADAGQVGGGSVPHQSLVSFAVALAPSELRLEELERSMRLGTPSVVGHIHRDRYLLNLLTLSEQELEPVAQAVAAALLS